MIYRIDVRTVAKARDGDAATDPLGEAVRQQIREFGTSVGPIQTRRIFLIDTDAEAQSVHRVAGELLADAIVESAELVDPARAKAETSGSRIEIHLKPGVMDPVAASTSAAIADMGLNVREVRTGRAYLIGSALAEDELKRIASRVLANGVIESVHFEPFIPTQFETGHRYRFQLRHVALRNLTDAELARLSREGHLFLSLAEMKSIQSYYREQNREPTDIELETLAQTWSEHCVHKTLKSAVEVEERDRTGKVVGTRRYSNLIKETIFDSTMELMQGTKARRHEGTKGGEEEGTEGQRDKGTKGNAEGTEARRHEGTEGKREGTKGLRDEGTKGGKSGIGGESSPSVPLSLSPFVPSANDFCLSVFADNAGVIAFDETDAVCFKVETHNHPSAIEPYGGSATGIGGVIRDILGTGLGAKPVANSDVFCVAYPDRSSLPRGVIHPRRVLQQVVAGVRDYGNRMGIPTVNGAVYFDDRYLGNPLVFCGCVGLIPRDKISKAAQAGDAIVVMGGRTGRDGIHGATFSSAELTDTHADEFSHAVQIGNAITQKKMADVILQARDRELFTAITDCGAGGLSSAVGEMGDKLGADVHLDKVPLKYDGLRYDEIWISEAQERMVLSTPREKLAELLNLAASEDVEATVIGTFGTKGADLVLNYEGVEVGRLSMEFVHHGIPKPTRKAVVTVGGDSTTSMTQPSGTRRERLLALLAHPNIASKHWVIRQYDHEVQGGSVVKPLIGPLQIGPSDAAVVRPKLGTHRGVVIGCGLTPHITDPYEMALWAIDEAVRNVVAVGADPSRVAILDNFCWPSVDDEITMGTLVRACEACRDAALAYGIPFISGKDSLHNQFTNQETGEMIRIPNTLLISAIGIIEDVRNCRTMDLKKAGNGLAIFSAAGDSMADRVAAHRAMASAIRDGLVTSCHDCSEGGLAVAVAEMCIASGLGLKLDATNDDELFRERCATYLIEFASAAWDSLRKSLGSGVKRLGEVTGIPELQFGPADDGMMINVTDLTNAWRGTLDW